MKDEAIQIEALPQLSNPLLIAGFDGWGNALDISRGMIDYMVRKLKAKYFGRINSDLFYRFDEHRPVVHVEGGLLKKVSPPGGTFHVISKDHAGRDIIFFKAQEPNLQWFRFVDAFLSLAQRLGVKTIISLGSMYDNVLHTDMTISALASSKVILDQLGEKKVLSIDYKGPSAIHSTIQSEAQKRGVECISLWCHCPYYLQGTTHYGLLSHLGSLLSSWGNFDLDTTELEATWREISKQIQSIIEKNPELQGMISDLRKAKIKGSWEATKKDGKIIHLEDFLTPK
jgi:proteasome assembly chaperone (PAC2) family protein